MSNQEIYLLESLFVVIGITWTAFKMDASPVWISLGVVLVIGIGIYTARSRSAQKAQADSADDNYTSRGKLE